MGRDRPVNAATSVVEPMIAAIYARKSTEQTGVADEQKSVTRPS